jgi:hypothetical protein
MMCESVEIRRQYECFYPLCVLRLKVCISVMHLGLLMTTFNDYGRISLFYF